MGVNHMFWVMADSHFNHAHKMKEFRPVLYEDKIITGLLSKEINNQHTTLIHLGDVCIGNDKIVHDSFFKQLVCKKILVRGNHDSKTISWYLQHGWDMVVDSFDLEIYGQRIRFSHRPTYVAYNTDDDVDDFDVNIHGHIHSNMRKERFNPHQQPYHVNLCPEAVGYKPLGLRHIIEDWAAKI